MRYEKGSFITVPNIKTVEKLGDAYAIATFVLICKFADGSGACYPSISTLAKLCGCSTSTLKIRLKKLESDGLIKKIIRKKKNNENDTNLYQILIKNERKNKGDGSPKNPGRSPGDLKLNSGNQNAICGSEKNFSVLPNKNKIEKAEKKSIDSFQSEMEKNHASLSPSFNWKTPEGVYADYYWHCVEIGPRVVWNEVEQETYGRSAIHKAEFNVSGEQFAEIIMAMMDECVGINPSGRTLCYTPAQWQALEEMAEDRNIGLSGFSMAVENVKHYQEFEDIKNEEPGAINEVGVNLTNIDTPVSIRNEFRKILRYDSKRRSIE